MQFANSPLLFGLAALLIPVLIHLLTRHRAKPLPWGAMQFLLGSVVGRNRRMLLEEALLLVVRHACSSPLRPWPWPCRFCRPVRP